ncbi:MAG TPA: bifunctional aspartate kinase/homoserine dehydrogenase I, partial [Prolixibacteraceae bacterium]
EAKGTQIVTGFIASTMSGETTTLGRGGSDYTAAIIGAALKVEEIQIWTDVDGILSADPHIVPKAIPILEMSFDEALEMSYFGAKVIYPLTINPARLKNIPIVIKNTFNKSFAGTKISTHGAVGEYPITGISTMGKTALLKIQGSGISEEGDMTARLFKTFSLALIKVFLISQASPGSSICLLVDSFNAEKAKELLEAELKYEIAEGAIHGIEIDSDVSILAVVGENIRNFSGISAKIFNALSTNGINIEALAQGSSRLNISLVIKRKDESKALNSIHDTFFLSDQKTINLFIAGTGLIGRTLYQQLKNQVDFLITERKLELKIIGIANTRRMLFDTAGIDLENWERRLHNEGANSDTGSFIEKMIEYNLPNSLFVDCTSSEKIIAKYLDVLTSAISIVTPNKKANSTHFNYYLKLRAAAKKHNVHFLYETNVGAGLPIISTLQDLVLSGDKILKIEGVMSGTLSYIFNTFSAKRSFSKTVIEARKQGYTEPDPRDDLNGLDVARKLLILVREAQYPLELDEIDLQNLIPLELQHAENVDEFLNNLHLHDHEFEELREKAEKNGKVLRYIAKYEDGKASVKLTEVNQDHPFYSLSSNDNILSLTTVYYNNSPMVIRGPGAGAKVTSGGVLADIVRIANYL